MSLFPAILIGGPPHSGKSVLVYSLTQALRARGVVHYAMRACPDGEGDFSNETDQAVIRLIRRKGTFSDAFNARVADYLRQRRLPLLVDAGGRPTDDQIAPLALCSGAILLVGDRPDEPGRYAADRAAWLALVERAGVPLLADLRSELSGANQLTATAPVITGTLAGLERGQFASGPAFEALIDRLAEVLAGANIDSEQLHRTAAPPYAHLVDVEAPAPALGAHGARWEPGDLPALAAAVPSGESIAIYGRAPNWVYAFLALRAMPAEVWLFDVRHGWMTPPPLPHDGDGAMLPRQSGWGCHVEVRSDYTWVELITTAQYLDPSTPESLPLPPRLRGEGLVLSGRMPHWLLTAAARQLASGFGWLAVYQPPLGGAVVVWPSAGDLPPGRFLAIASG